MGDHKGGAGRRGRGAFVGEEQFGGMPNVPSVRQLETDARAMRGQRITISADEQLRQKHAGMLEGGPLGDAFTSSYRATYNKPSRRVSVRESTGLMSQFRSWTPRDQVNYMRNRGRTEALRDLHDMLLDNAGFPF